VRLPLLGAWALALFAVALAGNAQPLQAQEGAQVVLKQQAGLYQVAVAASSAQPYVGHTYLWISVADAATAQPVTDAQVRILVQRSVESTGGQGRALPSPTAPGTYVADVILDKPGTWRLAFQITGPLGEATAALDLEVRETPRNPWVGTIGLAVVFLVLVLGGLYVVWSGARRRRTLQP